MESISKILNIIKKFCLVKCEIIEGSIKSGKFKLLLVFNGIIEKGKSMTINQLADIINKRFDIVENDIKKIYLKLEEHDAILKEHSEILKKHGEILEEHSKILTEHSEIFKRNNLK